MLQKASKKTVPLPSRPEQPTVVQIVEDVGNSSPDDIIFNYLKNETIECHSPDSAFSDSTFSFGDTSKLSTGTPSEVESTSGGIKDTDTESVYQKTLNFIQQTEQLRDAPSQLNEESSQLESLSEELKTSIVDYKEQAQTLLDKNSSSKS